MKLKKIFSIMLLIICSLWAVGCANQAPAGTAADKKAGNYHKISAQDAKARMEKNPAAIILDVRSQEEYQEKHIDKAILLPLPQLPQDAAKVLPDKNAEILVYCRSGNRSRQAAEKLIEMGYTAVYDFGGIKDWSYATIQ